MSAPMGAERLAEIRQAVQRADALTRAPIAIQISKAEAPIVAHEHRAELLSEVDRLAAERDSLADIVTDRTRSLQLAVERERDLITERDAARAEVARLTSLVAELEPHYDTASWLTGERDAAVDARDAARAELAGMRQRTRDLLLRCADGRNEYAKTAPTDTAAALATEANALRNAARIAMGDMDTVRAMLPSWRWTPDLLVDLPGASPSSGDTPPADWAERTAEMSRRAAEVKFGAPDLPPVSGGSCPHGAELIADQAIGLMIEYRDQHGQDETTARLSAVRDVVEGSTADVPPTSGGRCPHGAECRAGCDPGGPCAARRVVVCGSVRSSQADMWRVAEEYRAAGWSVLCPEPSDRPSPELDRHWLSAIETARRVVIVRKPDGSLGAQTTRELEHATKHAREVVFMAHPAPDGDPPGGEWLGVEGWGTAHWLARTSALTLCGHNVGGRDLHDNPLTDRCGRCARALAASPRDPVTTEVDHDCNAAGHPPCDGDDGLVDELTADDLLDPEGVRSDGD